MRPSEIARYIRTAAQMHPRQVIARMVGVFKPAFYCATKIPAQAGESPHPESFMGASFHEAGPMGRRAVREIRRGVFSLYGWSKKLGFPGTDWMLGARTEDRLFSIALHYHGFAPTLAHQDKPLFKALMTDWMDRCDFAVRGASPLAWNPYATATRIVHWCRAYAAAGPAFWRREAAFESRFLASLRTQCAFVFDNPEQHLLGNHLIRDALGMACWSSFFGSDSGRHDKRRRTAEVWTRKWVADQVLPDFGHAERSPMYHVQVMEDLELIRGFSQGETVDFLNRILMGMRGVLGWMRHPDGQIPLLNDAALNGAAHPSRFGLGPVPRGSIHFRNTGLFIHHGSLYSVFFDLGEIGDRWQPGHAHADSLSFECSWRGERFIVDPGTYAYDPDDRRAYDRATIAHNTLCVDGQNSSECWAIFRVGRRAHALEVAVSTEGDEPWAQASHDGYRFLSGKPVHRRRMIMGRKFLHIRDEVSGGGRHGIVGGLLMGPGWAAKPRPGGWDLNKGGLRARVLVNGAPGIALSVKEKPYHPGFGVENSVLRLEVAWSGPLPLALEWKIFEP